MYAYRLGRRLAIACSPSLALTFRLRNHRVNVHGDLVSAARKDQGLSQHGLFVERRMALAESVNL